ncbi:hypothetical protein SAMD00019534_080830 [Acytostelium subglobosum LB1]|uniref:hypothetical protein n=1 Tax=Acytostelium subglobosum LB1 TaxID=1410327 RepID=UPI000644D637|nr:hypothetical protein SAMD00019534_080830 [Acytostelium subglobosum LB1]GAM24908.1 hypothetical protein SAMD00019534_080830 [Acytostelium subglobosum LB1]|eukprot:XP_012751997.1 hypothetical protein SAMD00019534_080830 [Acytostelium subglobosum LB1]
MYAMFSRAVLRHPLRAVPFHKYIPTRSFCNINRSNILKSSVDDVYKWALSLDIPSVTESITKLKEHNVDGDAAALLTMSTKKLVNHPYSLTGGAASDKGGGPFVDRDTFRNKVAQVCYHNYIKRQSKQFKRSQMDNQDLSIRIGARVALSQDPTIHSLSQQCTKFGGYQGLGLGHVLSSLVESYRKATNNKVVVDGFTVDDARRTGLIYLRKEESSREHYFIFLPFMMLKWLNERVNNKFIDETLMFFPSEAKPWTWRSMELLFPYYISCLCRSVDIVHQSFTLQSLTDHIITFKHIFRDASGVAKLPSSPIDLVPKMVLQEMTTDLSTTLTTVANLPDKDHHDHLDISRTPAIFICKKNTYLIDHRTCFVDRHDHKYNVYFRVNHNDMETPGSSLTAWYESILQPDSMVKIPDGESMILVHFTNNDIGDPQGCLATFAKYCQDHGLKDRYLLLIHSKNIHGFISDVFANRAQVID